MDDRLIPNHGKKTDTETKTENNQQTARFDYRTPSPPDNLYLRRDKNPADSPGLETKTKGASVRSRPRRRTLRNPRAYHELSGVKVLRCNGISGTQRRKPRPTRAGKKAALARGCVGEPISPMRFLIQRCVTPRRPTTSSSDRPPGFRLPQTTSENVYPSIPA